MTTTPEQPVLSARTVWRDDLRHVANHLATVALTCALGVAPLVSDPSRFSGPAFGTLRNTIGMYGWGAATLIGGLLLLAAMAGNARAVRWALFGTGVLHLVTAVGFVFAQSASPDASPLGWLLFGGLALRHAMQALWFPTRTEP